MTEPIDPRLLSDPEPPSRIVSIRLPNELADELVRRSEEVERSLSWYCRNALQVMVEQLESASKSYPDPLPDRSDGAGDHRFTATFAFAMPMFCYPEDTDTTAIGEGRIGTERRVESALSECASVLRRWGCTDDIVVHSIFDIGGARLPSRMTNHPAGTTTIG